MATPSPDHINRPDFGTSVRGYDRAQVDAYFGRVVERLADAENRAAAAERTRESLAREVTDLRMAVTMLEDRAGLPAPQSMSAFSERMGQVMESALQAAQELRDEADREAEERRDAAAQEAQRLVVSARDEAERIADGAQRAQQEMEESIERLRASRVEAVEILLDLQRQIAEVVGEPEPSRSHGAEHSEHREHLENLERLGGLDDAAHGGGDVTMMVPAIAATAADGPRDAQDAGEASGSTEEVLVTATPTIVQPAGGRGEGGADEDGGVAAGRRRRSA